MSVVVQILFLLLFHTFLSFVCFSSDFLPVRHNVIDTNCTFAEGELVF